MEISSAPSKEKISKSHHFLPKEISNYPYQKKNSGSDTPLLEEALYTWKSDLFLPLFTLEL